MQHVQSLFSREGTNTSTCNTAHGRLRWDSLSQKKIALNGEMMGEVSKELMSNLRPKERGKSSHIKTGRTRLVRAMQNPRRKSLHLCVAGFRERENRGGDQAEGAGKS